MIELDDEPPVATAKKAFVELPEELYINTTSLPLVTRFPNWSCLLTVYPNLVAAVMSPGLFKINLQPARCY